MPDAFPTSEATPYKRRNCGCAVGPVESRLTDKPVTSLEREVPEGVSVPGLEEIAHEAARRFGQIFGQQVLAVESPDALREQACGPKQNTVEDTPMEVPDEVRRLHGDPERPVRA